MLDLKYKINSTGGYDYIYQCRVCGQRRKQALKKADALRINSSPKLFDLSIEDKFFGKRKRLINIRSKLVLKANNKPIETKSKVVEPAIERKKNEAKKLLEELTKEYKNLAYLEDVILELHNLIKNQRIDSSSNSEYEPLKTEKELKSIFKKYFIGDFIIFEEVKGIHLSTKTNVKIDFVLAPRKHLLDKGFIPDFFGVEVKYINPKDDLNRKTTRGIWQTISYNDCEFEVKTKNGIRKFIPKFSMFFSNLSFFEEYKQLDKYYFNKKLWYAYIHLANHANVGVLNVTKDGWVFKFGTGGLYFSKKAMDSEILYRLHNERNILKKRVGNFQ